MKAKGLVPKVRAWPEVVLRRRCLSLVYRILTTTPLPVEITRPFHDRAEFLLGRLADLPRLTPVDGLVTLLTDTVTAETLRGTGVRVVSNIAVGYNNIDAEALARLGILVCHTPDVLTDATADLTLLLILATLRRLLPALYDLQNGYWQGWSLDDHLGRDPKGKRLGIIGLGRIGRAVAKRAEVLGMDVVYWSRRVKPDVPWRYLPLPELLASSDVLSLHLPLNRNTYHFLDAERLTLLKPGAVLINTARGALVDESALLKALEEGRIAAAGLDVFEEEPPRRDHPFLRLPNVVATPHIGSATVETRWAMARLAVENAVRALEGHPQHVVPQCAAILPRPGRPAGPPTRSSSAPDDSNDHGT